VTAFGAKPIDELALSFCFFASEGSEDGVPLRLEIGVFLVDVLTLDVNSSPSPVSSSSSLPNESFVVPALRFFFLVMEVVFDLEGSWGVDALYLVN